MRFVHNDKKGQCAYVQRVVLSLHAIIIYWLEFFRITFHTITYFSCAVFQCTYCSFFIHFLGGIAGYTTLQSSTINNNKRVIAAKVALNIFLTLFPTFHRRRNITRFDHNNSGIPIKNIYLTIIFYSTVELIKPIVFSHMNNLYKYEIFSTF